MRNLSRSPTFLAHKTFLIVAVTVVPLLSLVVTPDQCTILVFMVVGLSIVPVGVSRWCLIRPLPLAFDSGISVPDPQIFSWGKAGDKRVLLPWLNVYKMAALLVTKKACPDVTLGLSDDLVTWAVEVFPTFWTLKSFWSMHKPEKKKAKERT